MLKILLKKELLELSRVIYMDNRGKKRTLPAMAAYVLLYLFVFAVLAMVMAIMADALYGVFAGFGMKWLYFAWFELMAIAFGTIMMMFSVNTSLYAAKDNELLMAMPVPVSDIVDSRLFGIWLLGLFFEAMVLLPVQGVYLSYEGFTLRALLAPFAVLAAVSLLALALACTAGYGVAKLTGGKKGNAAMKVAASLVFLGLYYGIYFNAQKLLQQIMLYAMTVGESIQKNAVLIYGMGKAGEGDVFSLVVMLAVSAVLLLGVRAVLISSFDRIAGNASHVEKKAYKETSVRRNSVQKALLIRELSHFASSASYILNCSIGTIFMVAAGVFLVVKKDVVLTTLQQVFTAVPGLVNALLIAGVVFLSATNDITAPSVSLEGKQLWLSKVLPVDEWSLLKAKLQLHLLMTSVPSLLISLVIALFYPMSIPEKILLFVIPQAVILLEGVMGLVCGLLWPNLHWTNEIAVIKQSLPVAVSLFGSMIYGAALPALLLLLENPMAVLVGYAVMTIVLSAAALSWLKTKGAERYRILN